VVVVGVGTRVGRRSLALRIVAAAAADRNRGLDKTAAAAEGSIPPEVVLSMTVSPSCPPLRGQGQQTLRRVVWLLPTSVIILVGHNDNRGQVEKK
jgi:hypothetical protein